MFVRSAAGPYVSFSFGFQPPWVWCILLITMPNSDASAISWTKLLAPISADRSTALKLLPLFICERFRKGFYQGWKHRKLAGGFLGEFYFLLLLPFAHQFLAKVVCMLLFWCLQASSVPFLVLETTRLKWFLCLFYTQFLWFHVDIVLNTDNGQQASLH